MHSIREADAAFLLISPPALVNAIVSDTVPGSFTWALWRQSQSAHPLDPHWNFQNQLTYMAFVIQQYLPLGQDNPESNTDSPLCSPRNTSLNFLRGFPKSPPADMVAEESSSASVGSGCMWWYGSYASSLRRGCAGGSTSPHRMMGMQLSISILLSLREATAHARPHLFFYPAPFNWTWIHTFVTYVDV